MNNEEKILVLLEQHSEMFAQINSRLDKMDERLNRMDSRLDKMDERLDRMEEYAEITRDGGNAHTELRSAPVIWSMTGVLIPLKSAECV